MLVLSRKKGERIVIGSGIEVVVLSVTGNRVRLGVAAPREVPVHREDPSLPEELPAFPDDSEAFVPVDWSDDGQKILGYLQAASGARAGIAVFSIGEQSFERLTDFGYAPAFFSDSRSIVFQSPSDTSAALSHNYQQDSKLYFLDSETGSYHELLAVIKEINMVEVEPSEKTVQNILNYSKSVNSHSV